MEWSRLHNLILLGQTSHSRKKQISLLKLTHKKCAVLLPWRDWFVKIYYNSHPPLVLAYSTYIYYISCKVLLFADSRSQSINKYQILSHKRY